MSQQQTFVTSIGRVVGGDLYDANDKDAAGNPRVIKRGANAGKPTQVFEFAVAIPKVPGQHWAHLTAQLPGGQTSPFGAIIYQAGQQGFPQGQWNNPNFAWKVTDGDSQIPNSKGRKPCDREGYPGHWVFWFSSQYAPRIVNADGSSYILEKDAVKPGYFVQVQGSVAGNEDTMKPGIYLNHNVVSLQGYGPEIKSGPDPATIGFGAGPAVAGMQSAPTAGMGLPPPSMPVAAPPVAAPVATFAPPPAMAAPIAAAPAPVAVAPHPGFLQPPVGVAGPATAPPAPVVTSAPPPPPPAAVPQMTALAKGATYQSFVTAGWNDAQMRAAGYLV